MDILSELLYFCCTFVVLGFVQLYASVQSANENIGGDKILEYNIRTEQGFEEMYHEYFPKIYNYIFYHILSKEDTEDLVSIVFGKVAKSKETFDVRKASFTTWIFSIARNALTDYYRKKKVETVIYDEADSAVMITFEKQLEQITSEKRKIIFEELAKLKEKERMIIYYKFFCNYNNRQIAMMLDMNESTVGTVLARSLKKLRTDKLWQIRYE